MRSRYAFVPVSVAVAALVTFSTRPLFGGRAPLTFFFIAAILSAGYGGFRAGLLATALSTAVIVTLFQNATFVLALAQSSILLFAATGVVLSIVLGRLHALNVALQAARDDLEANNRMLAAQSSALRQSNEELHRFAYALAHDLRTPLRTINAFTTLLAERNKEKFDDRSHELAAFIGSGAQRMESMIKGLLEYAAAVDDPAGPIATDANVVLARVLEDHHHEIASTGARIEAEPLPWVLVNPHHLSQVFGNLLGNALKYAGDRPVIQITATDAAPHWSFCVKDNGIGFEMAYAEKVFGMFQRLHTAEAYEGRGIGLALCKAVLHRYGGKIWVETAPGKGAAFLFTLPKAPSQSDEDNRGIASANTTVDRSF